MSLHFFLLGLQNWVFQLEAELLSSQLRIEVMASISLIPASWSHSTKVRSNPV